MGYFKKNSDKNLHNELNDTAVFFKFFGAPMILMQKVYCCASLRWFNNLSCLFLSFLLITSGVQLFLDKS